MHKKELYLIKFSSFIIFGPHLDSYRPLVGKSGGSAASMEAPAPQDRDKLIPLTLEDIQIIKTVCGISDKDTVLEDTCRASAVTGLGA